MLRPGPSSSGLLGALLFLGGALDAQTPTAGDGRGMRAGPGVRVSRVSGDLEVLVGGQALVALSPRWALGGAGWILPERRPLEGDDVRELTFGYGGVRVQGRPVRALDGLHVGVLLGAARTGVRDGVVGTELDADNLLVAEVEVGMGWTVFPGLSLEGSLGRRGVVGVESPFGVEADDLTGWSVTVMALVGPF